MLLIGEDQESERESFQMVNRRVQMSHSGNFHTSRHHGKGQPDQPTHALIRAPKKRTNQRAECWSVWPVCFATCYWWVLVGGRDGVSMVDFTREVLVNWVRSSTSSDPPGPFGTG